MTVRPRGHRCEVGDAGIEPAPARYQRAVPPRTPASDESSGGRIRTCASRVTVARLAARPRRNEQSGPGRIRTCTPPIKSRQLLPLSYGAEVWPAGLEPAQRRVLDGRSTD